MSLTLKESCRLYEQHCRRRVSVPTFEEFNTSHATCLPLDGKVYNNFKQIIELAYKAEGVPVTRRLPGLFSKFATELPVACLPPSVQLPVSAAPVSVVPSLKDAFQMNIRAPVWSLESYKSLVLSSSNAKMKESKGLIVHLMPPERVDDPCSFACKLTKSNWNVLRGRDDSKLSMRDGSELSLSSIELDKKDVSSFVRDYKSSVDGPFFIRFSRI